VRPFSIDMLPVVEALFQAADLDDLGRRIARAADEHFHPSRVALLELEGTQDRYRVLGIAGAARRDAAFVSRTMVAEAARRGVAHYAEGARDKPLASVVRSGASSAIAAGIRAHDGRVRVLYLDTFLAAPRLSWGHALSLQLFAAHASAAYEALGARQAIRDQQRRFEQLRRYFSPAVADHIVQGNSDVVERAQNLDATVLFADLVGYTSLSERLRDDPERLLGLLNRWLDAGAQAVLNNGGTLDKFIGDAVMGVFGAPFPAPDGELLAVRCALEMREAVARLSVELGERLAITVGINSGHLLAASVGSRRRLEYTVLGDTVNVASRLQSAAQPGEILLGPETTSRVAPRATVGASRSLALKNHAPVEAAPLLGLRA
jgi:adenylate cyclase